MPKVNKIIAQQIYTLKETKKKKFYLAKAYTNKTYGLHMLCIFEELLDFFRFFIFISHQNPGHKILF